MFSFLLAVLVLNNKLSGVSISSDFYNFAIFCILSDAVMLAMALYAMYKGARGKMLYVLSLLYILGIVQASFILTSGQGNRFTDDTYGLSMSYIVISVLAFFYMNYGSFKMFRNV